MSVPSSQKSVPPNSIHHVNQEGKVRPEKNSTKTQQQDEKLECASRDSDHLIDLKPSSPPTIRKDDPKDVSENENHASEVYSQS